MSSDLKSISYIQKKAISTVKPIGKHSLTSYPEVVCPSCNRHFYWRQRDKEMYCVCGAVVKVDETNNN